MFQLYSRIVVFPDIDAVRQYIAHGVVAERLPVLAENIPLLQIPADFLYRLSVEAHLKNLFDDRSGRWIDLQLSFLIDDISERNVPAVPKSFQSVFGQPALDFLGKFG